MVAVPLLGGLGAVCRHRRSPGDPTPIANTGMPARRSRVSAGARSSSLLSPSETSNTDLVAALPVVLEGGGGGSQGAGETGGRVAQVFGAGGVEVTLECGVVRGQREAGERRCRRTRSARPDRREKPRAQRQPRAWPPTAWSRPEPQPRPGLRSSSGRGRAAPAGRVRSGPARRGVRPAGGAPEPPLPARALPDRWLGLRHSATGNRQGRRSSQQRLVPKGSRCDLRVSRSRRSTHQASGSSSSRIRGRRRSEAQWAHGRVRSQVEPQA